MFCKSSPVNCLHFLNNTVQSTNIEFLLSFSLPISLILADGFSQAQLISSLACANQHCDNTEGEPLQTSSLKLGFVGQLYSLLNTTLSLSPQLRVFAGSS